MKVGVYDMSVIEGTELGKCETSSYRNWKRRSREIVEGKIGNLTVGINDKIEVTGTDLGKWDMRDNRKLIGNINAGKTERH